MPAFPGSGRLSKGSSRLCRRGSEAGQGFGDRISLAQAVPRVRAQALIAVAAARGPCDLDTLDDPRRSQSEVKVSPVRRTARGSVSLRSIQPRKRATQNHRKKVEEKGISPIGTRFSATSIRLLGSTKNTVQTCRLQAGCGGAGVGDRADPILYAQAYRPTVTCEFFG